MQNQVDVSVIIPTYNHERYIEKAIKSVLMQKVTFCTEVIVGEDCSTDNTRSVLKRIEPTLPSNFTILYRERNNDKGSYNFKDLRRRARGKYIITLEGDDFWTYEYKLQKQYEFLEKHKEYLAVAHNVIVVDENDMPIHKQYPECKKNEYTIKELRKGLLPGQTASVMYRNWYKDDLVPQLIFNEGPGDILNAFKLAANGKTWCIQEHWSAYRYVTKGGSSYSANVKYSYGIKLRRLKAFYDYAQENCKESIIVETEKMYYWYLLGCALMKKENVSLFKYCNEFTKAHYKRQVLLYCLGKLIIQPFDKLLYFIRKY